MNFVSPAGTLKSSEKVGVDHKVELSSAPNILVLLCTSEATDSETLTLTVAVTPSAAVMVTVWSPTVAGMVEKVSFELSITLSVPVTLVAVTSIPVGSKTNVRPVIPSVAGEV